MSPLFFYLKVLTILVPSGHMFAAVRALICLSSSNISTHYRDMTSEPKTVGSEYYILVLIAV
jgi:hypothetical protein